MTPQEYKWALMERQNCVDNIAAYTRALADLSDRADDYREIIALAQRRIPQIDAQIALYTETRTDTEGESAN